MLVPDPVESEFPLLVVAICTFRRPRGLSTLLRRLAELEGRERVMILVVDNDPDGGAAVTVDECNARSGVGAVYRHAVPQGLATARNVALDFGGLRSLPVLFVDDDEVPEDSWLLSMLSSHDRFPDAIIAGPVRPTFMAELPSWAPDGFFWRRREHADDASLQAPVGDGNMLFPPAVTAGGLRYDIDFDLTGGQDTHLLMRWLAAEGRVIWSARAVVNEQVPVERLTLKYAQDRTYFGSLGYQRVLQKLGGEPYVKTLARFGRQLVLASLCCIRGLLSSSAPMTAKASLHIFTARGIWAGMRGRGTNRWLGYQADV